MRKLLSLLVASIVLAGSANATGVTVIDLSLIAQSAANQVANYAKEVQSGINQVVQIEQGVTSIENQVLELERLGNPATYVNLLNLNQFLATSSTLVSGVGQTIAGFRSIESGAMALSYTGNGLYANLQGTLDRFGNPVIYNTQAFAKFSAVNGSIQSYMTQQQTFNTQMASLQSQLSDALQKLNSAPDLISTVKYNGLISSLHGQISALTANSALNGQATAIQQSANQNIAARDQVATQQQEVQERETDLEMEAKGFSNLVGGTSAGAGVLP